MKSTAYHAPNERKIEMRMNKLEGILINDFIEELVLKTGLDFEELDTLFGEEVADWIGIDFISMTYVFVYLSDLIKVYKDCYNGEDEIESLVLDALTSMQQNSEEDYFIIFND